MTAFLKFLCPLLLCMVVSIGAVDLATNDVPVVGEGTFCSQLVAKCNRDENLFCARSGDDMEDVNFGYCKKYPSDGSGGNGEACFAGCVGRDAECCREGLYCGCTGDDYCPDDKKLCVPLPDFDQEGCGAEGQTCCRYQWLQSNQESCAEGLVCNTKNQCTKCGAEGNPCCRKVGANIFERVCDDDGMYCKSEPNVESECVKGDKPSTDAGDCGQNGKSCCGDEGKPPCGPGMICYSNTCESCGFEGNRCCPGRSCYDGFACQDQKCSARSPPDPNNCGNPGQECCLADSFTGFHLVYCNAGSFCFDDSQTEDDEKVISEYYRSQNAQCVSFEGKGCGKEGQECCHRAACDAGMYCDTQMSWETGTCNGVCEYGTNPPSVCKKFADDEGGEGQPCFSGFYRFETRALNQCLCREGLACSEETGLCMKNPDDCGLAGNQCCRQDTGLVSNEKSVRCQRYFRCNCNHSGSCGAVGCGEDPPCTCQNEQLPVESGGSTNKVLCVDAIA